MSVCLQSVIITAGHTNKSRPVGLFPVWPIGTHRILPGKNEGSCHSRSEKMVVVVKIGIEFKMFAEAEKAVNDF